MQFVSEALPPTRLHTQSRGAIGLFSVIFYFVCWSLLVVFIVVCVIVVILIIQIIVSISIVIVDKTGH